MLKVITSMCENSSDNDPDPSLSNLDIERQKYYQ